MPQAGCWDARVTVQAHWLGAPEAGLSCWCGSLPCWGCRVGSKAAQLLWSGRTGGYTQQLARTGSLHSFLSGLVKGSMVSTISFLGSKLGSPEVPGQPGPLSAVQKDRATGWDFCLGAAVGRSIVHQDLRAGSYKPQHPPFPSLPNTRWSSPTDFPQCSP